MATISENLQILKDSTDAIKQAIIDKGGTINGDITTWASAIGGISGGGSSEEEYTFTGTITYNTSKITLSGKLSSKPELDPIYLILLYCGTSVEATKFHIFDSDISNNLTTDVDTREPLLGNEIPGICLMHATSGKIFPVKFEKEDMSTNPT